MKFKKSLMTFLVIALMPLVSAYSRYSTRYSLDRFLENPNIMFALIFIGFFVLIFFALNNSISNKAVSAVLSVIISLFISFAVSKQTRFYGYLGEEIGNWMLVVVLIVITILFVKFIFSILHGFGLFLSTWGLILLLRSIDVRQYMPYKFFTSDFYTIWEFLTSTTFLYLTIGLFIALLIIAHKKKGSDSVKKWMWGDPDADKSSLEKLADKFLE
ncbi:MAG: hypothetical protein ACOCRO_11095 [Halanaerobiales bacterium]